jgi:hypothetical protein
MSQPLGRLAGAGRSASVPRDVTPATMPPTFRILRSRRRWRPSDDVGQRRQLTEASAITAALGSENIPSWCLALWLKACTASFVAWKFRQLSECLSARPIGPFWCVSAERIRKGRSQLMHGVSVTRAITISAPLQPGGRQAHEGSRLCRWPPSRALRERLQADHMARNSPHLVLNSGLQAAFYCAYLAGHVTRSRPCRRRR